jgi:galactonate dehydratase
VTPPPATVGEVLGDRVHGVETFLVDGGPAKSWVWVRLQSTDGVVGWGECYTAPGREPAIRALAGELGRSLAGREVGAIRHFTSLAYRDFATKRGSLELSCAVSGLEQAMWDVLGKTLGRPVHALLGGPCRERFRVYANGWSYGASGDTADLAAAVARAQELVAAGWSALKFDPFQGPWRPYVGRDEVRAAVECVAAVREAVGPGVDLLVEVHRRLAPPAARRLARELEPLDPFWLEEPVDCRNVEALRDVAAHTTIPIVTGETLYSRAEFLPVLERRAAGIVNPDVASCGGILELTQIAAMADAHLVAVAPHNYNSTALGLAATIHAAAVMPNFLITEYFVNYAERSRELVDLPLEPVDGYVDLPTAPGLGIEVDEAAVRGLPAPGRPTRRISSYQDET